MTPEQIAGQLTEAQRGALEALIEAAEGAVHFSDAVAYRDDALSVALRQWLNELPSAISGVRALLEKQDADR